MLEVKTYAKVSFNYILCQCNTVNIIDRINQMCYFGQNYSFPIKLISNPFYKCVKLMFTFLFANKYSDTYLRIVSYSGFLFITYVSARFWNIYVFHNSLPQYLNLEIERVQRRCLKRVFPGISYEEALKLAKLETLHDRRSVACKKRFLQVYSDINHKLHDLIPRENSCSDSLKKP